MLHYNQRPQHILLQLIKQCRDANKCEAEGKWRRDLNLKSVAGICLELSCVNTVRKQLFAAKSSKNLCKELQIYCRLFCLLKSLINHYLNLQSFSAETVFLSFFILPSTLTCVPVSNEETQLSCMMLPPPCLTLVFREVSVIFTTMIFYLQLLHKSQIYAGHGSCPIKRFSHLSCWSLQLPTS